MLRGDWGRGGGIAKRYLEERARTRGRAGGAGRYYYTYIIEILERRASEAGGMPNRSRESLERRARGRGGEGGVGTMN